MNSPKRIRILCVDHHPIVCDGLAFALRREFDMEVVAKAADSREAIDSYRKLRPDITLMGHQMPSLNGIETLAAIRQDFPKAKVIVLTTHSGDVPAYKALQLGAAGYLLKGMDRTDLVEAIRCVHSGQRKVSPQIAADLAEHFDADMLSSREIEVLKRAAEGDSNKIIAQHLGITEQTVKGYMKSVFSKIGAKDRTHAVIIAMKRGFLDT
jgi:DNA-binding NarL/FixJ family response regulator